MKLRLLNKVKKSIALLTVSATAMLSVPGLIAHAEEAATTSVLVYSDQEGMGSVTSTANGIAFDYMSQVPEGSVIICHAAVNPRCVFEGWYVNGTLKSTSYDYSFVASGVQNVATAHFRQVGQNFIAGSKHNDEGISQTNWSNKITRFAEGSGSYDIAVTTSLVEQGEECMKAFGTVLEDFTIANTFNLTFNKTFAMPITKFENDQTLIFSIPTALQKAGREFRMISVFNGQPKVHEDLDDNGTTVTFETDTAGAYALVYRDTVSE